MSSHQALRPWRRVSSSWGIWVLLPLATACTSYPRRTQSALADFERGQLPPAYEAFRDEDLTGSEFLAGAEAGMVALADGRWEDSIHQLERAMDVAADAEREALISAGNLEDWLVSWVVNEGGKRYVGEGYERVMLHACSALARLAQGDLDGARVEARRANRLLEREEELYEKEYMAGGLGHFVSALVYELDGKPDEALIDYDRMRAKGVGRALACRAITRLAHVLGREEDYRAVAREFESDCPDPESACIVVIAGVNLGPFKREHTLTIPTGDGLLQWSVPSYQRRPVQVGDLELSIAGGDRAVRTIVIEDVSRVAKENLDDRLLMLAGKSAVRGVLKRELSQALQREIGPLGGIAGGLYTILSERADLRCWTTLPDTWQAARVFVAPGAHTIALNARGGERVELGRYELDPRETLFVIARTVGTRLYAHPVGGRRVQHALEPQAHATHASKEPAGSP